MRTVGWRLAFCLALAGCGGSSSEPDGTDGGDGDTAEAGDGGEVPACTPVATSETACAGGIDEDCDGLVDCGDPDCPISGSAMVTYVTDEGEATEAADFAGVVIEGLVDDGAGGFSRHAAVTGADGSFVITGVPRGPYYLRWNRSYIVTHTDDCAPDLGWVAMGRPDAADASTHPTDIVFELTELDAWQAGDHIDFLSTNAGGFFFAVEALASAGAPAPGATSLSGMTVDYAASAWRAALVDGARGDRAVVVQRSVRSGVVPYTALTRILTATGVTQTDGAATTVSGALSAVPQTGTVAAEWRRSEFAALTAAAHPAAEAGRQVFSITAVPGGTTHGQYFYAPLLLEAGATTADATDPALDLAFGNPFDPGWSVVGIADAVSAVDYTGSSGTGTLRVAAHVRHLAPLTSFGAAAAVSPLLGPVANVRINGADAFAGATGVGESPTVSWDAPSLGLPGAYVVQVYGIVDGATDPTSEWLGLVQTEATSVVLPPGLLAAGGRHFLRVTATRQGEVDLVHAPWRQALPAGEADVLTGVVEP